LDFGRITVSSKIKSEKGYWLFLPEKEVFTTTYIINTSNISFYFNQAGQHRRIFNNETLNVGLKMLNSSPFMNKETQLYT